MARVIVEHRGSRETDDLRPPRPTLRVSKYAQRVLGDATRAVSRATHELNILGFTSIMEHVATAFLATAEHDYIVHAIDSRVVDTSAT